MSTMVPPAPTGEAASAALARLARYAEGPARDADAATPPRRSNVLLGIACALLAVGIFLLVCTIAVVCAPDSHLSQVVFSACAFLP